MKTRTFVCGLFTVMLALAFTACPIEATTDDGPTGPAVITYSAVQNGGENGTKDSTGIVFTFGESVDELNLSAANITVSGAAEKGSATFTGAGKTWTLAPIIVKSAGQATVSIIIDGKEGAKGNVIVHKAGQPTPEYWSITWHLNGGAFAAGSTPPTLIEKGSFLPFHAPIKSGNTFGGWYTNSALTQMYNFASAVTANLNLYAKWETVVTGPAHTHNWGEWTETVYPGTEERLCKTDPSHIEHRLTGTDRFNFEPATSTSYRVSQGTLTSGEVYIPAYYRPSALNSYFPVTEIGGNTFNNTGITRIIIPAGVTSIGDETFRSNSFTGITVDSGNPNYASEGGILYNKARTTLIRAPGAISGTVSIPAGVTTIASYAFYNCGSLTGISIPAWVTSIGDYAFAGYYSSMALSTVTFAPNSQLQNIGENAFEYCGSLTGITIPASVTTIGNNAFSNCTSLTTITIPASVTFINGSAFNQCNSLASVTVDPNNQNYASQDGILYNKAKTSFVYIPQAISGNITIPAGVTSIGDWAFNNRTSLASITIPASVTSIGNYAFYYWTNSQTIYIRGHANQASANAAWGSGWRTSCNAVIKYWNGSEYI